MFLLLAHGGDGQGSAQAGGLRLHGLWDAALFLVLGGPRVREGYRGNQCKSRK
jgi:hypothetical protein